ncbi:hypothetical protein MASR1M45_16130 [Candidatus Kapaibacterium sp.]
MVEYITRVELVGSGQDYSDNQQSTGGNRYFPYRVFSLTAGQTYTFRVYKNGNSNSYHGTIFMDTDFSGTYQANASERSARVSINQSGNSFGNITFTVPANTPQGTTQMRIIVRNSNNDIGDPCDVSGDGEIEDYTVYVINPNFTMVQQTGAAIPYQIASIKINGNSTGNLIQLSSDVSVLDSVQINSGQFSLQDNSLFIQGDLINNSGGNGLGGNSGSLVFDGILSSSIRGTSTSTSIYNLFGRKTSNVVNVNQNLFVNKLMQLDSNSNFVLNANNTITFNDSALVNPGSGSFSKNKMIQVDGSSNVSYVTKKFVNSTAPTLSYCVPNLSSGNRYITRFRIGSLDNQNNVSSGYFDYSSLPAPSITAGVNTQVIINRTDGNNTRYWRIWIDYNQDGAFDTSTEMASSGTSNNETQITTSVTIPNSAFNGNTRLRVRIRNNSNLNNPCENTTSFNGEFEDYTINITGGTDKPAVPSNISFTFPIGTDNVYNPALLDLNGSISTNPSISVLLKSGLHPNRIDESLFGDDVLNKFWRVQSSGISNITSSFLNFGFENPDVNGNIDDYIPASYNGTWEINLGSFPIVENNTIKITPTVIDTLNSIDGDWTAGAPLAFFYGRKFYSIKNGDWNDRSTWSNISHTGARSQYFPGDIFFQDTVFIDGYTVIFKDSVHILIDSLSIGGTNNANSNQGILTFGITPQFKTLELRQITTSEDGFINSSTSGLRQDTIKIRQDFNNNSVTSQQLWFDDNLSTHLLFYGSGISKISGNGPLGNLAKIIFDKSGDLNDSLIISSSTFPISSLNSPSLLFIPKGGVLRFDNFGNNYISSNLASETVAFQPGSGIHISNSTVSSRTTLSTNSNTSINIENNGIFNIGNDINESFLYGTGTNLFIENGEMNIAAGFSRLLPSSLINLTIGNSSLIKVNILGCNISDQIGFDISNLSSTFNMNGGRIIIVNKGSSLFDYRVNSSNGLINGGVIQVGDSNATFSNTTFRIGGVTPVFDVHLVADSITSTTELNEISFNIKNNLLIDSNHTFKLNSNTLNIGGNLSNFGSFDAVPLSNTTDPWMLVFNGSGDQTITNLSMSGLNVFNLRMNKPNGRLILNPSLNSNLIIRNTLEFASNNYGIIDASGSDSLFISVQPAGFNNSNQVLRVGLGHVYGMLYQWVKNGPQNVLYTVGSDTLNSYRPALIESAASNNTPGLLGVRAYNSKHPDFNNVLIRDDNDIERYWFVNRPALNGFQLGSGSTYSITTYWVTPGDTIGLGNPNTFFYEHFLRSPGYAINSTNGNWSNRLTVSKGNYFLKSDGNNLFGDFVVGEPNGLTFYSRNSGSWNNPSTWSLSSYYTDNVPTRFPNDANDIVRIGNGKRVTIPANLNPEIRSVFVEKDPNNNNPGELYFTGNLGFVKGVTFVLEDDCTIGLQHLNGITPNGNTGAVQTSLRQFGVSRYVYNSYEGSQNTGIALPDSIKTIVISNPTTINPNKTVFLNRNIGSTLVIKDSVVVEQGNFNSANKNLRIYNSLILDSIINNGWISPSPLVTEFAGNNQKYIKINNRIGLNLNNVKLTGGDVFVFRTNIYQPTRQHIRINGTLDFGNISTVTLGQNINISLLNSSPNALMNYGSQGYIRTSDTSGLLIRTILPGTEYYYPIGSYEKTKTSYVYTPVVFNGQSAGNSGTIGIRTSPGRNTNVVGAHRHLSTIPIAEYLLRYWVVDSVTATINGMFTFKYDDSDILSDENKLSYLGKWTKPFELLPGQWDLNGFSFDINTNSFSTNSNLNYQAFIGDWTLGNYNAFRRIFYSRNNGVWNNDQNWTFNANHSGVIFGNGVFPNNIQDSVVIGANHEIIMDGNYDIQGIAVGTSQINPGTLDFGQFILGGLHFTMGDFSTLKIGHPDGIVKLPALLGNLRTTSSRSIASNGIYGNFVYNGINNQVTGNALPDTVRNLSISNLGPNSGNSVLIDKNITILNDLNILFGKFDIAEYKVNKPSISGIFNLDQNTFIRLGKSNNLLNAINNFSSYNINFDSYVEFYGSIPDNQIISDLPIGISLGLGYVNISNSGTKFVTQPMVIRRDLTIFEPAILENNVGVNSLQVNGNIVNRSVIENKGIIEIGE